MRTSEAFVGNRNGAEMVKPRQHGSPQTQGARATFKTEPHVLSVLGTVELFRPQVFFRFSFGCGFCIVLLLAGYQQLQIALTKLNPWGKEFDSMG